MLLSITHTTDLHYSDYINESVMELRMAPLQEQFQHRLSFGLDIGPATTVKSYFDWLGNTIHAFSINAMHNQIQIIATSIVQTDPRHNRLEHFPDIWIRDANFDYTLCDFLLFGGKIVDSPQLRGLAASAIPQSNGRNSQVKLGTLVTSLLRLIDEKFVYQKSVTDASSSITEILEHGRGVCQDFTHLMIGMARALNIPARYVSGYLHPDRQRLRGYTQTHAWVEIFFPSMGWVGVDPTNNCIAGENFVKVAIGRHYQDVPPNKGVYKGKGEENMEVAVHSEELLSIPLELAAERTGALNLPCYAGTRLDTKEQQAEQEQQEQQEQQQQ
jgi:transglutaminase-like putative cysteine protease